MYIQIFQKDLFLNHSYYLTFTNILKTDNESKSLKTI